MNKMTIEEFKNLYYTKQDYLIADIIGVKSSHTVRNYARKLGFKLKGKGYVYPDDKRIAALSKFNFLED